MKITDETELKRLVVCNQRSYEVPADVYDELEKLRGQACTLRDACEALMVYVELTGWGDLALAGTGDKATDDQAIAVVTTVRAALAATAEKGVQS